jgi:hypothetical protein
MFITKMSLPRRTFLRGVGATVALPLLEAMVPALTATAKTAANPRLRFGVVYVPHGVITTQWTPATTVADFAFPRIIKPLEPFRDVLTVVSRLDRPGGNNHAVACAAWTTAAVAKPTEAEDVRAGISIDQLVARQIGQDTPFPSLEVATEDFTGFVGGCSTGYACAYMNTISWSSESTPLPMEINPRVVFERLFGRAGTTEQRQAERQMDRSILDSISEDVTRLRSWLGSQDRARLSEYLDHVREIERRIQRAESQGSTHVDFDAPVGVPESYGEHAALLFDLMKVAYQSDQTRVFSFMMARDLSTKAYPNIGVVQGHHEVSHHGNGEALQELHAKINTYHVELFAQFLERLRTTPDGDGSLLDHSLIVYGSGMGDGNIHGAIDVPTAVVGRGAALRLKGNRHLAVRDRTPLGNLWLSVAQKTGIDASSFGDSNGTVDL